MSRFREQQSESFEYQVDEILRDLEELKTAQFTGQASGMLAKLTKNSVRVSAGDVVDFSYNNGSTLRTAEIPLSKTPDENFLYQVVITHRFTPKHDTPTIALPDLKFGFITGGVSGESTSSINGIGQFTRSAPIIKNGSRIGDISSTVGFNTWFLPKHSTNGDFVWETTLSYASREDVKLSLDCSIISNNSGTLTTTVKGIYNETN